MSDDSWLNPFDPVLEAVEHEEWRRQDEAAKWAEWDRTNRVDLATLPDVKHALDESVRRARESLANPPDPERARAARAALLASAKGKSNSDLTFEERQALIAERAADTPEARVKHLVGQLVTSSGLDAIPEPDPLVDGVLYLDSLAYLIGPSGNGKSFVALDLAGCVGSGETWQGYPAKRGKVLYMAAEGVSGIKQRVRAWESSMGYPMAGVAFLPTAVQIDDAAQWRAFVALCVDMKPALIVLDTQARITLGLEENSAKDMGHVVARLDQLRRLTGACVLVVHHQGRTGEHMRGSSALDAGTNTVVRVAKDDDLLTITCAKQKDAVEFDEFKLRLVPYDSSAILSAIDLAPTVHSGRPAVKRMLAAWWHSHETDWVSLTTLVDSEVVAKRTFHNVKKALAREGIISSDGKGRAIRYRMVRCPDDL